jgi:heme-degrading monooxygenase HmoA
VIARVWRGAVRAQDAEAYARYIEETGLAEARALPGNRGAYVLHRVEGELAEVKTVILWDSLDDVRAFAGDDVDRAVFFPEDDRWLVERDLTVRHYEAVGYGG